MHLSCGKRWRRSGGEQPAWGVEGNNTRHPPVRRSHLPPHDSSVPVRSPAGPAPGSFVCPVGVPAAPPLLSPALTPGHLERARLGSETRDATGVWPWGLLNKWMEESEASGIQPASRAAEPVCFNRFVPPAWPGQNVITRGRRLVGLVRCRRRRGISASAVVSSSAGRRQLFGDAF